MTQKQLNIFVPIFFLILAGIVGLTRLNQSNMLSEIREATINNLDSVIFYKDFLRDSEGLELALTETEDLENLLTNLQNMERTSAAAKELTYQKLAKIQLVLDGEKTRHLEIKIVQVEEWAEDAFITISTLKGNVQGNGGKYSSRTFLPWLEEISKKPGFDVIWELY